MGWQVLWNDAARSQPEDVYKRSFWTESFVQWAPHGSLLATIHRQGIAVWGGASFARLCRMSHQKVSRGRRPRTLAAPEASCLPHASGRAHS